MNIDERLDRLVERHEALTQTVEHLALRGEEQGKLLRLQGEEQGKHLRIQGEHLRLQGEHIDRILSALEKDGENIRSLVRVAEIHEHRIADLERSEPVESTDSGWRGIEQRKLGLGKRRT